MKLQDLQVLLFKMNHPKFVGQKHHAAFVDGNNGAHNCDDRPCLQAPQKVQNFMPATGLQLPVCNRFLEK